MSDEITNPQDEIAMTVEMALEGGTVIVTPEAYVPVMKQLKDLDDIGVDTSNVDVQMEQRPVAHIIGGRSRLSGALMGIMMSGMSIASVAMPPRGDIHVPQRPVKKPVDSEASQEAKPVVTKIATPSIEELRQHVANKPPKTRAERRREERLHGKRVRYMGSHPDPQEGDADSDI